MYKYERIKDKDIYNIIMLTIDTEKSVPKYLQLKEIIKRYLEDEHYKIGQKIPSETELIEQFHVSRGTVRQTLRELVNDGVIYTEKGRGSFFSGKIQEEQHRSYLIGVLTPMSSYIYPQIIQGINDIAHQKHYSIVMGSSNDNPERELAHIERFLKKHIDGLLIEPTGGAKLFQDSKLFHLLKELTIPVVFMDWAIDDPDVSYVSLDDVAGGFRATSYLIEAGHKRIACVYPNDNVPGTKRYQGYRKALATYGVEYDQRLDKTAASLKLNTTDQIYRLTKELIELGDDRPSAVFFYNDRSALYGYAAIRETGLKIPDDLSVIGYDDSELAALADVPLTSVIHPKYQSGKLAAEILFDQIEHNGQNMPRQLIINPTLAVRDSVKFLHCPHI